ncbi:MAG TPA: hypothetical protein VGJ26_11165 [Pirellulales bacterium]
MLILIQFVLRLAFGMAAAMTLVSPRQVTSGYYRNNLYVLLGLNVLVTLAVGTAGATSLSIWLPVSAAVVSYLGAACWLYERPTPGMAALGFVAVADLVAAWLAVPPVIDAAQSSLADSATGLAEGGVTAAAGLIAWLDPPTGGLVLGSTMAAMLLGHWYLNAPGMALAPLRRLIALMLVAVVLRALVCGWGLEEELTSVGAPGKIGWALFVGVRWLAGLLATALLAVMSWQTLKIPNTQSATGILYVAVITTFLGELASGLLSAEASYPL